MLQSGLKDTLFRYPDLILAKRIATDKQTLRKTQILHQKKLKGEVKAEELV